MDGGNGIVADGAGISQRSLRGEGREPSVLVVGDGPLAVVTAAFLERAGLNSLLASATGNDPRKSIQMLWEPGLTLLEAINIRRPVEQLGTIVEGRRCLTTGRNWTAPEDATAKLVTIRNDRLRALLGHRLRDNLTETDQSVTGIQTGDSGARATFEGVTTERFDTIVATTRTVLPPRQRVMTGQTLHTWQFEHTLQGPRESASTEAWDGRVAAFSAPVSGARWVRLVSAAQTLSGAALSPDALADQFGHLTAGTPFATLDQRMLHYQQIPHAVPVTLTTDGVVLLGAGSRLSIPGDFLSATLGIEDAWVLADTLATGPSDTESAVNEYVRRRRNRHRAIATAIGDQCRRSHGQETFAPVLCQLHARRRLAFSHIVDQSLPDIARDVPEAL